MNSSLKISLFILLGMFACKLSIAQFASATVNGTIAGSEYGTHVNGQNQETNGATTTYMSWDATNLYIAVSGANVSEAIVIYLDKSPVVPVNGGTVADGTLVGFTYDGTGFAELPFRADAVIYAKDSYREFRLADGSGGWSSSVAGFGSFSGSGSTREISVPWSVLGFSAPSLTTSFNFYSYITSAGGFVYGELPSANPEGFIGTTARYSRYYTVTTSENAITATKPFSRDCYTFNSATDITGFGDITVFNFTMNTATRSLTRAISSNWTIANSIIVGNGTINFGATTGTTNVSGSLNIVGGTINMGTSTNQLNVNGNVNISGTGTLTLSSNVGGDLNVSSNFTQASTATFTPNNRAVIFSGSNPKIVTRTGGGSVTFSYLLINGSGNVQQSAAPNATNVIVNGNGGDIIQMTGSGNYDINGQSLNLNGVAANINIGTTGIKNITSSVAGAALSITGGIKTIITGGSATLNFDSNVAIILNAGLNFGSNLSTVNGFLSISSGGFVSVNPPNYSSTSTLEYSSGGTYIAGAEWTTNAISGAGVPQNVIVTNNTNLSFGTSNQFRAVIGNYSITSGSQLTLSTVAGGDIHYYGNASFPSGTSITTNQRTIHFKGTANQSLNFFATFFDIDHLWIDKTSGTLTATYTGAGGGSLRILGTGTNNDMLYLQNGTIILDVNTELRFQNTANKNIRLGSTGTRTISAFRILGTGTTIVTTDGATMLNVGTLNCDGPMNCGAGGLTTVTSLLQLNLSGSFVTNSPIYGTSSQLNYEGTGSRTRGLEWNTSGTVGITPGSPRAVTLSTGITLNFGTNPSVPVSIPNVLTIQAGATMSLESPSRMTADVQVLSLFLNGTLIMSGSSLNPKFIINNGNATINGTLTQNGNFFVIQGTVNGIIGGTNVNFSKLQYNRTSGVATHSFSSISIYQLEIGNNATFRLPANTRLNLTESLFSFQLDGPPPSPPYAFITQSGSGLFDPSTNLGTLVEFNTGTLNYIHPATNFRRVIIRNGTLVTTNSITITDTLRMMDGATYDLFSPAPIYGASSWLVYQSGSSIYRGQEFSTNSGAGSPRNVLVTGTGTILDLAGNDVSIQTNPTTVQGNMIIEGNAIVSGDIGTDYISNLTVNGNLSVGNVGNGTLTLGDAANTELIIRGNFTVATGSTFTPNTSKLKLIKSTAGPQLLSINGTGVLNELELSGNAGAQLLTNVTISDDIEFDNSGNGHLDLNNFNLIIGSGVEFDNEDADSRIINTAPLTYGIGCVQRGPFVVGAADSVNTSSSLGIRIKSTANIPGLITLRRYPLPLAGVGSGPNGSINRIYEVISTIPFNASTKIELINAVDLNLNPFVEGSLMLHRCVGVGNFTNPAQYFPQSPTYLASVSSPTFAPFSAGSTFFTAASVSAIPLVGPYTVPGSFPDLFEAINQVNINGVGAGGANINFTSGTTNLFGNIVIDIQNNAPTPLNPLVISGAPSPLPPTIFNAYPGGTLNRDGIIIIHGTGNVTLQNITINDPIVNDNNFERMEWGIAILKRKEDDACKRVVINNMNINLQKLDTASTGIYIGNHSFNPNNEMVITNPAGVHDSIVIIRNTITNVNKGILLRGFEHIPGTLLENNIIIGDTLNPLLGNTIQNFGGNTTHCFGINIDNARNVRIGNNTINNITGGGTPALDDIRGISIRGYGNNYNVIANNTVSLNQGITNKALIAVNNQLDAPSASLRIKGNIIQNNVKAAGNSGPFYGIRNTLPEVNFLRIDENRIINNTNINTTGFVSAIYNSSKTEKVRMLADTVRNFQSTTNDTLAVLFNTATSDSILVQGCVLRNITATGTTSRVYGYVNTSNTSVDMVANPGNGSGVQLMSFSTSSEEIKNNTFINFSSAGSSEIEVIDSEGRTGAKKEVKQNNIRNITSTSGNVSAINLALGNEVEIDDNSIRNLTSANDIKGISVLNAADLKVRNDSVFDFNQTGAGSNYAISYEQSSGNQTRLIENNIVFDIQSGSGSGSNYGIFHTNSGTGSTNMTVGGNKIYDVIESGSGSGAAYGIFHTNSSSSGSRTTNFNNNEIYNISGSSASSPGAYGIFHTNSGTGSTNFTNTGSNNIYNVSGSGSAPAYGIFHTNSGSGSGFSQNFNAQNNTINNITTSSSAGAYGIFHTNSGTGSTNIHTTNNNNITNVTGSGGAPAYGIFHTNSTSGSGYSSTLNANNNNINNITASTSNNAAAIYHAATTTSGTHTSQRINNVIGNISNSGAGPAYGIFHTNSGTGSTNFTINNSNTISDITNSGAGSAYGIFHTNSGTGSTNRLRGIENTIRNISANSDSAIGLVAINLDSLNLTRNTISKISTTSGIIEGILHQTTTGNLGLIANTLMGDFTTVSSGSGNAIKGVEITGNGNNVKIYYNSIYLESSSSAPSFGTSVLDLSNNVTVELRNNILVNKSNAASGGGVRIIRRTGAFSSTYSNASNNNLIWVSDSTVANNFVYSDGTNNFQSFSAFKSFSGIEQQSFVEDAPFISTNGLNPNFLKINTSIQTRIESGGSVSNLGILTDREGNLRFGAPGYAGTGTATDIGAFENAYTTQLSTWLGLVNSNWTTSGNWTGNQLPNASRGAIIPSNSTNQPVINSPVSINSLTFLNNTSTVPTITIPAGQTLSIQNNISGNGRTQGAGKVILNGTSSQQIIGNYTATNIDVNNPNGTTVTGSGSLNVSGQLGLINGTLTSTSSNVRLTSSGNNAGILNDFSPGYTGTLLGNIVVDRFVPATNTFDHFISSPVNNGLTVTQNYQDDFSVSGSPLNYVYNTDPTQPQPSPFPTTWWYNETLTSSFTPGWINARTFVMSPGSGVNARIPQNIAFDVTGPPNKGQVLVNVSRTDDGFNLVGNPYPSPIRLKAVKNGNNSIAPNFYIWNGTNYSLYNSVSNLWINNPTSTGNDRLWHCQAMFVQSLIPGNTNLVFEDSMRTTGLPARFFTEPSNVLKISIKQNEFSDETALAVYEAADFMYNADLDAVKFNHQIERNVSISTLSEDNRELAINLVNTFKTDKKIPLCVIGKEQGLANINVEGLEAITDDIEIYLEDTKLNTLTDLKLKNNYSTTLSEGNNGNRFALIFGVKNNSENNISGLENNIYSNGKSLFINNISNETMQFMIYNTAGQLVKSNTISGKSGLNTVDCSNLSGVYLVRTNQNGTETVKKVVFK